MSPCSQSEHSISDIERLFVHFVDTEPLWSAGSGCIVHRWVVSEHVVIETNVNAFPGPQIWRETLIIASMAFAPNYCAAVSSTLICLLIWFGPWHLYMDILLYINILDVFMNWCQHLGNNAKYERQSLTKNRSVVFAILLFTAKIHHLALFILVW